MSKKETTMFEFGRDKTIMAIDQAGDNLYLITTNHTGYLLIMEFLDQQYAELIPSNETSRELN